jgi:type I restriction enzyme S subunit
MSEQRWDIPKHWEWRTAGEIGEIVGGGTPSTSDPTNFAEQGIPWLTPADLTGYKGKYISRGARDLSKKGYDRSGARLVPPGSILFSSRAPIGYCVIASNEISTNQGFKSLVPSAGYSPEYLRYYLASAKEYAESVASGTTFKELSGARMATLSVPVPPLPEQRSIVGKLDSLTARTARAREELRRIPILTQKYRKEILSAATTGELTREWRETNALELSSGKELAAIRKQRRASPKLARRKTIEAIPEIKLPPSWEWISPDEIASDDAYSIGIGPFGSNLVRSDYVDSGVRLVFVRDIKRERFGDDDARYITREKAEELRQHMVRGGEVLITKMGEPPGDTALYPKAAPTAVITADCIKLAPHPSLAVAEYLVFCIRSGLVRSQVLEITAGIAHQKVSLDRFRRIALPIPPLPEQLEILKRIEAAFSWLDRVAAEHANASRLMPKLDQAILAKAFCGELVSQDVNEYSAPIHGESHLAFHANVTPRGNVSRKERKRSVSDPKSNLTERISADADSWPKDGLTFEQIRKRVPGDYESIQQALFALLNGVKPVLCQEFDTNDRIMRIRKTAK